MASTLMSNSERRISSLLNFYYLKMKEIRILDILSVTELLTLWMFSSLPYLGESMMMDLPTFILVSLRLISSYSQSLRKMVWLSLWSS